MDKKKQVILKQEYQVSNDLNLEMLLVSLEQQLRSAIFQKLIKEENDSLTMTFEITLNESEE